MLISGRVLETTRGSVEYKAPLGPPNMLGSFGRGLGEVSTATFSKGERIATGTQRPELQRYDVWLCRTLHCTEDVGVGEDFVKLRRLA